MISSGPIAASKMMMSAGNIRYQRLRRSRRSAASATSRAASRRETSLSSTPPVISCALAMLSVPQDLGGVVADEDSRLVSLGKTGGVGAAVLLAHDKLAAVFQPQVIVRVGAEIDDVLERALDRRGAAVADHLGMLRPDHHCDLAVGQEAGRQGCVDRRTAAIEANVRTPVGEARHLTFEEVGLPDEVGHEALGRMIVDVARAADL